jgi:NADPH-dependent 2,4-dienoyl-CoA reductase/sulfur reductase-like enzyme
MSWRMIQRIASPTATSQIDVSRRDLLRIGTAAAGGLLSSLVSSSAIAQKDNGKRIIVIGAGFGDLSCAYELSNAGYSVKVFEARDRVGGRVHSLKDLVPEKTSKRVASSSDPITCMPWLMPRSLAWGSLNLTNLTAPPRRQSSS